MCGRFVACLLFFLPLIASVISDEVIYDEFEEERSEKKIVENGPRGGSRFQESRWQESSETKVGYGSDGGPRNSRLSGRGRGGPEGDWDGFQGRRGRGGPSSRRGNSDDWAGSDGSYGRDSDWDGSGRGGGRGYEDGWGTGGRPRSGNYGRGGSRDDSRRYQTEYSETEVIEEDVSASKWEVSKCICDRNKNVKVDFNCGKILLGMDCDEDKGDGQDKDFVTDIVDSVIGNKKSGGGGGILDGLGRRKRGLPGGNFANGLKMVPLWAKCITECWPKMATCWCSNGGPQNVMQSCGMDPKEVVTNSVPRCAWEAVCKAPPTCTCEYDACMTKNMEPYWSKFKQCCKRRNN